MSDFAAHKNYYRQHPIAAQEVVADDYLVTARPRPHEDGKVYSVNIEIIMVTGSDAEGKTRYGDDDNESTDPFEVDPMVYGFVKWDGCTQLYFNHLNLHIDHADELEAWFQAVRRARELCRDLLTERDEVCWP